jgi:heme exporter protein A
MAEAHNTHNSSDNRLILADKLTKAFGLRVVLRGISFSIARGATVALFGANGSGKTTLLRILSGLSRPTGGTLTIGGWNLPKEVAAVRAQIGFVGHQTLVYDDLTAEENLRFYARLYNQPLDCVPVALERVGLARRSRDLVGTFSRGMQQRMSIARAMLHNPAIMLLDEPFTGLDVNGAALLDELLREWRAAGRTIVMTSHDLEHAATLSDHVLIIHQGKITVDAPATTIDDLPELFTKITS